MGGPGDMPAAIELIVHDTTNGLTTYWISSRTASHPRFKHKPALRISEIIVRTAFFYSVRLAE